MAITAETFRFIDRAGLKAKLDNKEPFHLWNVVTKEVYKSEANIPGSLWMPVDIITEAFASEKVPGKGETIVVYCGGPQDPSSKQAAERLAGFGYASVFAYEGGLADWSEGGLPLAELQCEP